MMIRKNFRITGRQNMLIKRIAKMRGVSEAEIIRRAIEREISEEPVSETLEAKTALDMILEFVEERRRTSGTGEPYRWNREEIYAERAARWERRSDD